MPIRRGDYIRLCYDARRYLAHLSDEDLARRSQDIITNITILTAEGKIGLLSPKAPAKFQWHELWTHVAEEYALRRMHLPANCIDPNTIVRPTAPAPAKGHLEGQSLGKDDLSRKLTKYGNRSWLEAALATGEWLVSPASYYSDAALGYARHDSELEQSVSVALFERTSRPVEGIADEYHHTIKDVFTITLTAATDYYLVSLARGLIYRLFDDFHSTACLIIHDESEFIRRMQTAFAAEMPKWIGECQPVEYIDPCLPPWPIDIYFSKDFRFAYQEELRFVWTPSAPIASKLDRIALNLGPLEDICEILTLDDSLYHTENLKRSPDV
jgi:hypothetical protein